ncbi:MAG: beta strand repeat-containing protein, partial [Pyrinomonadaceae bacterium]
AFLIRGAISGGPATVLADYATALGASNLDPLVLALTIDPVNSRLYVGSQENTGMLSPQAQAGIRQYTYNGSTGAVTDNGFLVTAQSSEKPTEGGFTLFDPNDIEINSVTNTLFFTEFAPGISSIGLFRLSLSSPNTIVQVVSQAQFPDSGANGYIYDVEADSSTNITYFTTFSQRPSPDPAYSAAQNQIWYVTNASTATDATAVALSLFDTNGTTNFRTVNTVFYPTSMVFDQSTRQLYVASEQLGSTNDDKIYVFQLNAAGTQGTLVNTIFPTFAGNSVNLTALAFNSLPTFSSFTGNSTAAVEQGSAIVATAAGSTVVDDGRLSSATVQITGGTFTSTQAGVNNDNLAVGAGLQTSGVVAGTNITVSYTAATRTLTLTGYDTVANYQSVLASVRYFSLGDNPTNYGANTTRTLTWTPNDGALNLPGNSLASTTTTLTVTGVNDPPVNVFPGGQTVNQDTNLSISGFSISDVDASPSSSLTTKLSVVNGTLTIASAGGAAVSNSGTASVTLTGTIAQINTTLAAANNVVYRGTSGYSGPDTLNILTSDQGNTPSPAQTDSDNVSITVNAVIPPPNLSINDVTLNEGNSGTTTFAFTVSLSSPAPAGGVIFDIATADGTATQPSDYTLKSLTSQTIPQGSSTYTFNVLVNGDIYGEPNETFFVNVTNGINAIVTDGQGLGTITNDDLSLVVTKTADTNDGSCDADCSLREAIAAAQPSSTITFASPLFDNTVTLPLTLGELSVGAGKNLTITGRNAARTIISGNDSTRVFNIASGATVNINSLTIRRGSTDNGGGLLMGGATVTLTNCAVENNQATGNAGGLYNIGGTLNLVSSTVSGNSAGNAGGGIANGGNPSVLNVTNSTISGNSAASGGGIFTNAAVTVRSSTITANSAVNEGGGISNFTGEAVSLGNTIVAGNSSPTAPDFRDTLTSLGYNLIGNTNGTNITGDTTGNLLNQNAQLMPFNFYGGFTQTHALLPESPAVNAGTAANAPATDQRGRTRVGQTDIGAFELPSSLVVTNTLDSGAGSIRAAILAANATADDESITFNIPANDPGCVGGVCTITLTSGELGVSTEATGGTLFISNSTGAARLRISGNNAGRIFNLALSGVLALNGLTVTNGSAPFSAAINANSTAITVFNSNIMNSVATGNGGGIGVCGAGVIANSSIIGNRAADGGGIYIINSGICGGYETRSLIINSTVSGNTATGATAVAGGINAGGTEVRIVNTTVTNNSAPSGSASAGGIRNNGGTIRLSNSLVAGNTSLSPDIEGTINSLGYNLIGNTSGTVINGTTTGNILNPAGGARLAPLGFYGGQTQTHALLSGSPAINAGTSTGAPATDQRGASRVGTVDIGAFELNNTNNGGNFVAALPQGQQNTTYSYQLIPEAGATNYCISSGTLPPGMTGLTACAGTIASEDRTDQTLAPAAAVALGGTPTSSGTFNFGVTATNGGNTNVTYYALVVLPPTAASVSLSGRVLTPNGRGLRNAIVTLTDQNGVSRRYVTAQFGYYRFDNITTGANYVVTVVSKRYQFNPVVIALSDDLAEFDLIAEAK